MGEDGELDIVALKRSRSSYKGLITKSVNWAKKDLKAASAKRIEVELSVLERNFNCFSDIDNRVTLNDTTYDPEKPDPVSADAQTMYVETRTLMLEELDRKAPRVDPTLNVSGIPNFPLMHSSRRDFLPKLELPTFDGKRPELFLDFINEFNSMVHNNNTVDNVDKFRYLQSCLKDDAKQILHQLEVSAANYTVAYELLRSRYENKSLLVQNHINKLMQLTAVSLSNPGSVRKLLDHTKSHVRSMLSLTTKESVADMLLIVLTLSKLDSDTRFKWEESGSKEVPTWQQFEDFLEKRAAVLEKILITDPKPSCSKIKTSPKKPENKNKTRVQAYVIGETRSIECVVCHARNHLIASCPSFLKLETQQRIGQVKRLNLCFLCMKLGHTTRACTEKKCEVCEKPHHTVLHIFGPTTSTPNASPDSQGSSKVASLSVNVCSTVMIGTAIVNLKAANDALIPCRALLDSGSTRSFITQKMVILLKIPVSKDSVAIEGIGSSTLRSKGSCSVTIVSRVDKQQQYETSCLVLPKITGTHPMMGVDPTKWNIPTDLDLADPQFMVQRRVDLLIGADLFWRLIKPERVDLGKSLPLIQSTNLGWMVAGPVGTPVRETSLLSIQERDEPNYERLDELVERFWQLEQIPEAPRKLTREEELCEKHFRATVRRDENGRYVVRLPFSEDPGVLGPSYEVAMRRFKSIEKRLKRDPELFEQYAKFIDEYVELGHCEVVRDFDPLKPHAFIPHHCVVKPESTSTKLRVVFDASCKYPISGRSLNSVLMKGPKLQADLIHVLSKWRTYRFVFNADIKKMYRQVRINRDDCDFQLIVWRGPSDADYKILRLLTVTYGTKPGSFLAIKAVHQLAEDEGHDLPLGAEAIRNACYVDDCFKGANDYKLLTEIREQTSQLLERGGFQLSKFCSNHEEVLKGVPEADRETFREFEDEMVIRTLGMIWQPKLDEFRFDYQAPDEEHPLTKNLVLSQLARMYDPLGLVSPVVTKGKMIFQEICKAKIPWDQALPDQFQAEWREYVATLPEVKNFHFPRSIYAHESPPETFELHGYSDASQDGYGAACYLKVVHVDGSVSRTLLQSRSRVTPLKKDTMDITRLELEAALLLATLVDDLMTNVLNEIDVSRIVCWTDSKVVYHWIHAEAHDFDVFVRNRIAKIQRLSHERVEWRHVPGELNPADLISRGASIAVILEELELWLHGPEYLQFSEDKWPARPALAGEAELPEKKKPKIVALTCGDAPDVTAGMHFTVGYSGLRRSFAYVLRFIERAKNPVRTKAQRRTMLINNSDLYPMIHLPMLEEVEKAERFFVKSIQQGAFPNDYKVLHDERAGKLSKDLLRLAPFVDPEGVMRVGGRLTHAHVAYEAKHQMLLPANHRYTRAIFFFLHHFRLFHAGAQMMLRTARERYWPINGRRAAWKTTHDCLLCFRLRPKLASQFMGDLPELRVLAQSPFTITGVDFAGPYTVQHHLRCKQKQSYYVAVFVCFPTKAVHLEVVPNNSTDSFINALKRFIADHGRVKKVYSDNATNFVGTSNKLRVVQAAMKRSRREIAEACEANGVEWSFIPPRSPNFGGLWEAAVKLSKGLMRAVLQNTTFMYDDFLTVIRQVAAIINSRPITQMSTDPNDLEPLTPGHFLYGGPPSLLPLAVCPPKEVDLVELHQSAQQKLQQYWQRWSSEYFHLLQSRVKWTERQPNVHLGALVLLKKDNTPTLQWPMGRIVAIHPDKKGVVRVVTVKTKDGEYKRGITNIALLPQERQPNNNDVSAD